VSAIESRISCPQCGTKLNEYERRHRSVWQWTLFPNSRKYQCEHCGKKTFITNFNTYRAKENSVPTGIDPIPNPHVPNEITSEQQRVTTTKTPQTESTNSPQEISSPHTDLVKPYPSSKKDVEAADANEDEYEETAFVNSINAFLNESSPSKVTAGGSTKVKVTHALENQAATINPELPKSTTNRIETHTLLNFPNRFIRYQKTTSVEEEIEEARKIHLELQESINWSMDNFQKSQHFKLGLITENTRMLVESMLRNPNAIFLLSKLKKTDPFTCHHCIDASILAVLFGRHMGLTKQELNTLALSVLLLDIGKSQIPKTVLEKQNTLEHADIMLIQKHVQFSLDILKTTNIDNEILAIIESHHERYDGQGYPQRKQEKDISALTKMASIVDAYDAMTHNRPYRKALHTRTAINALQQQRGLQFQAELVDEFTHCLGAFPTGSMVILNTGQAGIVISQNEGYRLQPKLLIFRDNTKDKVIAPYTHDLKKESTGEDGKSVFIKVA